jgi:hypothetical protein
MYAITWQPKAFINQLHLLAWVCTVAEVCDARMLIALLLLVTKTAP